MQFFLQKDFQLLKELWFWSELYICWSSVTDNNQVSVWTEMQWWSCWSTHSRMCWPRFNCSSTCILVWLHQQTYSVNIVSRQSCDFRELTACVNDVATWFLENNLLLNLTQTEAVSFGTDQHLRSINHSSSVDVVGSEVKFTDALKLLGVTLDSSLIAASYNWSLSQLSFSYSGTEIIRPLFETRSCL